MDAVGRHETRGSETKDFILSFGNHHEHHVCFSSSWSLSPMQGDRGTLIDVAGWCVCVAAEEHCAWGIHLLSGSELALCLKGRH